MATGIGETLREAREERGLTLEDAAAETRIRRTHLEALEREDFDQLGGDVYVRGFIRSYARALEVDPQPLLERQRAASPEPPPDQPPPLPPHGDSLERGPRRGLSAVVAGLALLAIVGLAVWGGGERTDRVDMDRDPLAESDREDRAPDGDGDGGHGAAAPTPTPTPTAGEADERDEPGEASERAGDEQSEPTDGLRVGLEVGDREVWLQALADGEDVRAELLPPGSSATFEAESEIRLRLGDAGAVQLTVNGEPAGSPGGDGQPVWVTVDADGEVTVE